LDVSPTRRLFWPTLMSIIAVGLLLALGTWQMQRLAWKQHLLAQIEARTHAPPMAFDKAVAQSKSGEDLEYARVRVDGHFLGDKPIFLYAPEPAFPGYHLIMPLRTANGDIVLINRGFVPEMWRSQPDLVRALPEEETVVGLFRHPMQPGSFTPSNDVTHNLWYWRDLAAMTAATVPQEASKVVPFYIDRQSSAGPSDAFPRPGTTILTLPNRHLEYALTWYGLAVVLIGVYLAFAWSAMTGARREKQAGNTG
jgi:surfeit locus 1 family protein